MPELPEVETIRRHLVHLLVGRQVSAVPQLDARMVKRSRLTAEQLRDRLVGQTFTAVERRGKFLFAQFGSPGALLLHLGMSGRLLVVPASAGEDPHTHMIVNLGDTHLRLVDPRRFGRIAWVEAIGEAGTALGVDPLSRRFSGSVLHGLFSGRTLVVKSALLNQGLVAGLGNIYADEALFRARIHPQTPAGRLSLQDSDRLVRSIRVVLRISLQHGGTSFSDYVNALGHPGENQQYLNVYGRDGQPCPRCRTLIQRLMVGGRSSHFCPVCQVRSSDTVEVNLLAMGKEGALVRAKI